MFRVILAVLVFAVCNAQTDSPSESGACIDDESVNCLMEPTQLCEVGTNASSAALHTSARLLTHCCRTCQLAIQGCPGPTENSTEAEVCAFMAIDLEQACRAQGGFIETVCCLSCRDYRESGETARAEQLAALVQSRVVAGSSTNKARKRRDLSGASRSRSRPARPRKPIVEPAAMRERWSHGLVDASIPEDIYVVDGEPMDEHSAAQATMRYLMNSDLSAHSFTAPPYPAAFHPMDYDESGVGYRSYLSAFPSMTKAELKGLWDYPQYGYCLPGAWAADEPFRLRDDRAIAHARETVLSQRDAGWVNNAEAYWHQECYHRYSDFVHGADVKFVAKPTPGDSARPQHFVDGALNCDAWLNTTKSYVDYMSRAECVHRCRYSPTDYYHNYLNESTCTETPWADCSGDARTILYVGKSLTHMDMTDLASFGKDAFVQDQNRIKHCRAVNFLVDTNSEDQSKGSCQWRACEDRKIPAPPAPSTHDKKVTSVMMPSITTFEQFAFYGQPWTHKPLHRVMNVTSASHCALLCYFLRLGSANHQYSGGWNYCNFGSDRGDCHCIPDLEGMVGVVAESQGFDLVDDGGPKHSAYWTRGSLIRHTYYEKFWIYPNSGWEPVHGEESDKTKVKGSDGYKVQNNVLHFEECLDICTTNAKYYIESVDEEGNYQHSAFRCDLLTYDSHGTTCHMWHIRDNAHRLSPMLVRNWAHYSHSARFFHDPQEDWAELHGRLDCNARGTCLQKK